MARTGIGDAELARRVSVNRLTLIRWREGVTGRPRHREDVIQCANVLRLTPEERAEFLIAAGFSPDDAPSSPSAPSPLTNTSQQTDDAEGRAPTLVPDAPSTQQIDGASGSPGRARFLRTRRGAIIATAVAVAVAIAAAISILAGGGEPPTVTPTPSPGVQNRGGPAPDHPIAADGESLILLAPFVNYSGGGQGFNVSGRLRERIDIALAQSGLPNARTAIWPVEIVSEDAAVDATVRSGALLTIWGEYDSGRAIARFMTTPRYTGTASRRVVDLASSPADLPVTINVTLTGAVRHVALVTLGRVYLDQGEYDHAKAALARAADPPPQDPLALADVRLLLGTAYLGGVFYDYDEAILLFSQVLETQPRSVDALNGRARAFIRRGRDGDPARAMDDLTRSVSITPERADTHVTLGLALIARGGDGDVARAIGHYARAIELAPGLPDAYFHRGLAYSELGDMAASRADLERAVVLEPANGEYNAAACRQVSAAGFPTDALAYCDMAMRGEPAGRALFARAMTYALLERNDEASADLDQFLAWVETSGEASCHAADAQAAADLRGMIDANGERPEMPPAIEFRARPFIPGRVTC